MNLSNIFIERVSEKNKFDVDMNSIKSLEVLSDVQIDSFFSYIVEQYINENPFELFFEKPTSTDEGEWLVYVFSKAFKEEWDVSKTNLDLLKNEMKSFQDLEIPSPEISIEDILSEL